MWWWVVAALAGEPTSWVSDDGVVTGTVSLPLAPDQALALLSDPVRVTTIDGGETRVTVLGRDSGCLVVDYVSPSVFSDIKYRVRQCPRADGLESVLVQSASFSSYRARWTLTPEGSGTLLRYDLDMRVSMMVPTSLVNQTSKRAVRRMLERLLSHVSGGG